MPEKPIGHVTHWYSNLNVAGVHIDQGDLRVGETIHVRGNVSDTQERVRSMEIDHRRIDAAHTGDDIGVEIGAHVRNNDIVYKVTPEE